MQTLADRLDAVEERIVQACQRAGRPRSSVTLVAVTKKFAPEVMREAYELGLRHFGENYVQEWEGKAPALWDLTAATWHLIGHLQSNKAAKAAQLFQSIQTVDEVKLAERLDRLAARRLDVMVEVKLSDEQSKHGAAPAELAALAAAVRGSQQLRLTGLMTMPPWAEEAERSRPYFVQLRQLAEQLGVESLSMGMSHDLEVAIQEGATHIRVGTALFGPRPKPV